MPFVTTTEHITTAEQLLQASGLGRCELVRGELVMMTPAGFTHGRIAGRIAVRLGSYVETHALGVVTTAEAGFQIGHDPDTVRAPDVAFVRAERVPADEPSGFYQGAPDLAVEVLSPNDRAGDVVAKVRQWLAAGSAAVWVVDPDSRTVRVYRSDGEVVWLAAADTLSGGHLLPGFALPVAEIFPG